MNDDFIAKLTIAERVDLLAFIFDHNFFVNDKWFFSGTSDVSLITKIVRTLNSDDLSALITGLVQAEELFEDDNRDVLFEVVNGAKEESLKNISLDLQLHALRHLLGGSLSNIFEATNYQSVITKLVGSIKDENATKFFEELRSNNYLVDGKPLLTPLRKKLKDFLNPKNSYTEFFKHIKRLSDYKYEQENGSLEITKSIVWDVKNVDAILISFVRDNNDFTFNYNESDNTLSITTCKELVTINLDQGGEFTQCNNTEVILPEGTDPFELIGITIVNDISPFGGGCTNFVGELGYCGEMFYIPAIFVDYLYQNISTQRFNNLGWNTFNVVITAVTMGEGAIAISAIRGASASTKAAVVLKNAWKLADFSYTVVNYSGKAFGVEWSEEWNSIGWIFAARTSVGLIKKGGTKGLAYLRKAPASEKRRIIDNLEITKDGKKITESQFDDVIKKLDQKAKASSSDELVKSYELEVARMERLNIGEDVSKMKNAPDGYEFYFKKDGNKWIRRQKGNKSKPEYPRLTVDEGKIILYNGH